jgi:predicted metal-dependent enzyme (double-stranded beta helix superfamily)
MSDISTWLKRRLEADHDLERAQLKKLAIAIGKREELWRPFVHHDVHERFYQQLYRDPNIDVWLICWTHRQDTGYHDHDGSSGAVFVCEGTLWEDYFQREPDGWIREQTRRHEAGGSFDFSATYIHGVRNEGLEPATSIHVYSPALWRMGHYEPDPTGIMQRIAMTYADELLGTA